MTEQDGNGRRSGTGKKKETPAAGGAQGSGSRYLISKGAGSRINQKGRGLKDHGQRQCGTTINERDRDVVRRGLRTFALGGGLPNCKM